jgi:hypothetical protein
VCRCLFHCWLHTACRQLRGDAHRLHDMCVQVMLASGAGTSQPRPSSGSAPWRRLCGGLPPAVPMAELRLAAAFYEAVAQPAAAARGSASAADASFGGAAEPAENLSPLLLGAVAAAELQLQALWQRLGFLPADAALAAADGSSMECADGGGAAAAMQRLRTSCRAGGAGDTATGEEGGCMHAVLHALSRLLRPTGCVRLFMVVTLGSLACRPAGRALLSVSGGQGCA